MKILDWLVVLSLYFFVIRLLWLTGKRGEKVGKGGGRKPQQVRLSETSEPKTQCANCGAKILQRTADEYGGLCVPCRRSAAAIPPDDFELPHDLAERLISFSPNLAYYRQMLWLHGIDAVERDIQRYEEKENLYRKWLPVLREFADSCRKSQPEPEEISLNSSDRAKQQIYEAKIGNIRNWRHRHTITICRMPLLAMPVARRLWPGEGDSTVLLTPDEESRWSGIFSAPKSYFLLFEYYWWDIRNPSSDDLSLIPEAQDILTVSTCWKQFWLVTSGVKWGPMAGGVTEELWSWDGNQCELIGVVSQSTF